MSTTQISTDDRGGIHLEGDLTLPHAEELKSALIKALVNSDAVTIRFGNVQDLDLSCLQLFCSIHRSALRLKKQVHFDGNLPTILKDTAETAGYLRLKGCKLDYEKSCLWIAAAGENHG